VKNQTDLNSTQLVIQPYKLLRQYVPTHDMAHKTKLLVSCSTAFLKNVAYYMVGDEHTHSRLVGGSCGDRRSLATHPTQDMTNGSYSFSFLSRLKILTSSSHQFLHHLPEFPLCILLSA